MRLRYHRGKASRFLCVDGCGRQAEEWSQTYGTDGTDPQNYEPRCVPCHRQYDIDNRPRGEANNKAELTEAKVRGIYASVGATQRELAKLHGVTQANISLIRLGKIWRHITGGRKAEW